jgi:nucleotide-binding universal stress UspA family protein
VSHGSILVAFVDAPILRGAKSLREWRCGCQRIQALAPGPDHEQPAGMKMPRSILVPIDFSQGAETALDYAVELAGKLDAKVHLLNVIGIPALGVPELGIALTSTVIEQLIADNQAGLEKLAAARRATGRIGELVLKTGDARDVINQTCTELKIDLLVMGTHGRRGLSRALLGSVAESVVRTAPVPVLTVRTHE